MLEKEINYLRICFGRTINPFINMLSVYLLGHFGSWQYGKSAAWSCNSCLCWWINLLPNLFGLKFTISQSTDQIKQSSILDCHILSSNDIHFHFPNYFQSERHFNKIGKALEKKNTCWLFFTLQLKIKK